MRPAAPTLTEQLNDYRLHLEIHGREGDFFSTWNNPALDGVSLVGTSMFQGFDLEGGLLNGADLTDADLTDTFVSLGNLGRMVLVRAKSKGIDLYRTTSATRIFLVLICVGPRSANVRRVGSSSWVRT